MNPFDKVPGRNEVIVRVGSFTFLVALLASMLVHAPFALGDPPPLEPPWCQCEYLLGAYVNLGEAKVTYVSDGTEQWANGYHDEGSELKLAEDSRIGCLPYSGGHINFDISTYVADTTTQRCGNLTVKLFVYGINGGSCTSFTPDNLLASPSVFTLNTCLSSDGYYYSAQLVEQYYLPVFFKYKIVVSVYSNNVLLDTDSSCFQTIGEDCYTE